MSEIQESASKENLDPNQSPTRPNRQSLTPTLASPAQTSKNGGNSMWDSNNPMRNPPPLPLSPQMLRHTTSRSNITSPNSPGKLQFTNIDNAEIEHQLKRIVDAQISLKGLISGVDTSVKQTQIDLGNLVERSSNNNSHLKNLLQNVAGSVPVAPINDLSQERIKEIVESCIAPLAEKLADKREFSNEEFFSTKLEELLKCGDKSTKLSLDVLQRTVIEKVDQLQMSEDNQHVERLRELLQSQTNDIKENIQSTNKAIQKSLLELEEHSKQTSSQEDLITNNHQDLLSKLSSINAQPYFSTLEQQLNGLKSAHSLHAEELSKFNETLNNTSSLVTQEISKTIDLSKIESTLELLAGSQNNHELISKLQSIIDFQTESKSSNVELSRSQANIETIMTRKFAALESQISVNNSELLAKAHKTEIEKKDLEIQLRDQEIEKLKNKLLEQEKSQQLTKDISGLLDSKTRLETRYESLNEAYANRYQQFRQLQDDFDILSNKVSKLQVGKLTEIMGNAALASMSKTESKNASSRSSLPNSKTVISSRVLSTNSYLTNTTTPTLGTPKGIKKYDLKPIDSDDEKENIEL